LVRSRACAPLGVHDADERAQVGRVLDPIRDEHERIFVDELVADDAVACIPPGQAHQRRQSRWAGPPGDPGKGLGGHFVSDASAPRRGLRQLARGLVEQRRAVDEDVDVGTRVEQALVGPMSFGENGSQRGAGGQQRADARIASTDVHGGHDCLRWRVQRRQARRL
jgi:hypothetical protein